MSFSDPQTVQAFLTLLFTVLGLLAGFMLGVRYQRQRTFVIMQESIQRSARNRRRGC